MTSSFIVLCDYPSLLLHILHSAFFNKQVQGILFAGGIKTFEPMHVAPLNNLMRGGGGGDVECQKDAISATKTIPILKTSKTLFFKSGLFLSSPRSIRRHFGVLPQQSILPYTSARWILPRVGAHKLPRFSFNHIELFQSSGKEGWF